MKKYGNFLFARRVASFVLVFFAVVSVLIPRQTVKADSLTGVSSLSLNFSPWPGDISSKLTGTFNWNCNARVYSYIITSNDMDSNGRYVCEVGYVSSSKFSGTDDSSCLSLEDGKESVSYGNTLISNIVNSVGYQTGNIYSGHMYIACSHHNPTQLKADIVVRCSSDGFKEAGQKIINFVTSGIKSDGMMFDVGKSPHYTYECNDKSLGYLKDLKMSFANEIVDHSGSQNIKNTWFNFKWDTSNTVVTDVKDYNNPTDSELTGINISDGGYKIQWYAVVKYTLSDDSETVEDMINLDDIDADKGKCKIDMSTLRNKATKCNEAYERDHPVLNWFNNGQHWVDCEFHFRIFKDDKFGPWLQCYHKLTTKDITSFEHDNNIKSGSVDSSGHFTPDDNIDTTTKGSHASGGSQEEAEDNMHYQEKKQEDSSATGSNATFDNLQTFVSGIGDVPKMIADIFSFLPNWCLSVVAIGFALLMVLIVVKFIRG